MVLTNQLIYLVNVKTMRKIFSNFVCFSESPNFTNGTKIKIVQDKQFWSTLDLCCTRLINLSHLYLCYPAGIPFSVAITKQQQQCIPVPVRSYQSTVLLCLSCPKSPQKVSQQIWDPAKVTDQIDRHTRHQRT